MSIDECQLTIPEIEFSISRIRDKVHIYELVYIFNVKYIENLKDLPELFSEMRSNRKIINSLDRQLNLLKNSK